MEINGKKIISKIETENSDNEIYLNKKEKLIIETLLINENQIVPIEKLFTILYGKVKDTARKKRSIDAYICVLRKKLNIQIKSVYGTGFIYIKK